MNDRNFTTTAKMVATKTKNKVISCSTPERRQESPSRDSDSLCDSEAASPVPFLCTQDGAEGETDVVWNFYTPKSENAAKSRLKNSTPLSTKTKKLTKPSIIQKPLPKRRTLRATQKKTELFQDLIELNQNLHELIAKRPKTVVEEKRQSGSEDDIFSDSGDSSPKSGFRTNSRCLRRNVLSSKFSKPDPETALESDDSMNECLIKASQVVEENILNKEPTPAKRPCNESRNSKTVIPNINFKMDHDSMDAILNSIKLDSPILNMTRNSSRLINDSFDTLVGNLNDSALDQMTQMPSKPTNKLNSSTNWTVQEVVVHDSSPVSKSFFARHSSMPESPIIAEANKPSTSGMVFGRYNSMPYSDKNINNQEYSPTRCTQEEIKRKHQQAREKLLAKRLLPFTSTQQSNPVLPTQSTHSVLPTKSTNSVLPTKSTNSVLPTKPTNPVLPTKSTNSVIPTQSTNLVPPAKRPFQPRMASSKNPVGNVNFKSQQDSDLNSAPQLNSQQKQPLSNSSVDIKLLIEKKRQEALMRLRRRQPQKP